MSYPGDGLKIEAPSGDLGLLYPGFDGHNIDLSASDWVAATDANVLASARLPRMVIANFTGTVVIVPMLQNDATKTVTIAVLAGYPLPILPRKIVRSGCSANLQVANALVAGY